MRRGTHDVGDVGTLQKPMTTEGELIAGNPAAMAVRLGFFLFASIS